MGVLEQEKERNSQQQRRDKRHEVIILSNSPLRLPMDSRFLHTQSRSVWLGDLCTIPSPERVTLALEQRLILWRRVTACLQSRANI
jgi:hypothetical protein